MGNESSTILLLLVLAVALASLIIVKLVLFFKNFRDEVHYIRMEMYRAGDDNGYRYWRKRLRCCYLCLLPFVTQRNVERVYGALFHKPQHGRRSDGIWGMLAPSLVGMAVCAVSLCGMSWAWFTASISSSTQAIRTPEYTLTATVTAEGADTVPGRSADSGSAVDSNTVLEGDTQYALTAGQAYTVELRANGTDGAAGYCLVTVDGKAYCTAPITAVGTLRFRVRPESSGDMILTARWGTRAQQPDDPLTEGTLIGTEDSGTTPPAAEPAVQPPAQGSAPADTVNDMLADTLGSVPEDAADNTPDVPAASSAAAPQEPQQEQ